MENKIPESISFTDILWLNRLNFSLSYQPYEKHLRFFFRFFLNVLMVKHCWPKSNNQKLFIGLIFLPKKVNDFNKRIIWYYWLALSGSYGCFPLGEWKKKDENEHRSTKQCQQFSYLCFIEALLLFLLTPPNECVGLEWKKNKNIFSFSNIFDFSLE